MTRLAISWGRERALSEHQILEAVRLADEKGYEAVFFGEGWGRDAMVMLTHAACHTRNIRLGPSILNIFSRTPTLIAQSIATLDILSGGRALVGLGLSSHIVVEQWNGVPYRLPLQRTREYVEVVRLALSGERVEYEGQLFHLQRFRLEVRPVQEHIPIYLAADGPKNRALAGELADGWHATYVPVQQLPDLLAQVEAGARRVGRSLEQVVAAPHALASVSRDAERARELMRRHIAFYIGGMGPNTHRRVGQMGFQREADAIKQAWAEDRQKAASLVPDALLDAVTIAGGKAECRARLEQYRTQGADLPVLAFPHGSTLEMICETIEALAPENG